MKVDITKPNEVIDLWKNYLIDKDEARALLPIPTTKTVCEDDPEPSFVVGDDYSALPVGTLIRVVESIGESDYAIKLRGDKWYFTYEQIAYDSRQLRSPREILFVPGSE